MIRDVHALDGKFAPPERHVEVLVIGAGAAGTAAAIAAARGGAAVMLVDENPIAPDLMRADVPLYFGGRMTGAVDRPDRMIETLLAANPALAEAFDAGVEVLLGTTAWGLYVPQPGLAALPGSVVGLADLERSWLVGFDRCIVAAGARDLAFAFPGWEHPGVMGAQGFHALVEHYGAFDGRRLLIVGSGELAVATARLAEQHGIDVAAMIEIRDGHSIARVEGGLHGVERVVLRTPAGERVIECDTVCLAVGVVPAIELLAAAGARLTVDAARGGHVPVCAADGATSLPGVFAIGDCAGVASPADTLDRRAEWSAALTADPSTTVCLCEEVTRADLTGVQPPGYLGARSAPMAARSLCSLLADGAPDQDQIKRLTRAGMGLCQGRRCREQVALILAAEAGLVAAAAPFTGYRAPVRPLPLAVLADWAETAAMTDGWDVWFGIPDQWIPYADIGTDREAAHRAALGGTMHL